MDYSTQYFIAIHYSLYSWWRMDIGMEQPSSKDGDLSLSSSCVPCVSSRLSPRARTPVPCCTPGLFNRLPLAAEEWIFCTEHCDCRRFGRGKLNSVNPDVIARHGRSIACRRGVYFSDD